MRNSNLFLSVLIGVMGCRSQAAALGPGISGGADTLNPEAKAYQVRAAREYMGVALISFYRFQEWAYRRASAEGQQNSPFRKIFESSESIYKHIATTKAEIRDDEPCYDKDGNPKAGSIFAKSGYAICISSLLIPETANSLTIKGETLAIAAHEYAHLFKVEESEAEKIQHEALYSLIGHFSSLPGLVANLSLDLESVNFSNGQYVAGPLWYWREFLKGNSEAPNDVTMEAVQTRIDKVLSSLLVPNARLMLVPPDLYDQKELQKTRFLIARLGLCALAQDESGKQCRQLQESIFGARKSITFRDLAHSQTRNNLCINSPHFCYANPQYDQAINRSDTIAEVIHEFVQVNDYLNSIHKHISSLVRCGKTDDDSNCRMPSSP